MDRDALLRALRATFAAEARERVEALERALGAMRDQEPGPGRDELRLVALREAHSIKGAAGAVAERDVMWLAHALEDQLGSPSAEGKGGLDIAKALADLEALRVALERSVWSPAPESTEAKVAAPSRTAPPELTSRRAGETAVASPAARRPSVAAETAGGASVRVPFATLDAMERGLVALQQELAQLGAGLADAGVEAYAASQTARRLRAAHHAARELHQALAELRGVPFAAAVDGLDRALRELLRGGERRAELAFVGLDVRIDRRLVEPLRDALRHLLRNAVDHGVEPAAARIAAGKAPVATLAIRCTSAASGVTVAFEDDGRGVDAERVAEQARKLGVEVATGGAEQWIFADGLSTSAEVTQTSGRGVGLSAVRRAVRAARGEITVSSQPGRGTRFELELPADRATTPALLLRVGAQRFALPQAGVTAIARSADVPARVVAGQPCVELAAELRGVADLGALLGLQATPAGDAVVALDAGGMHVALRCDAAEGCDEVVERPLPGRFGALPGVRGVAVDADGAVRWVLQPDELALRVGSTRAASQPARPTTEARRHVLVVDDSATTRALVATLLRDAGYEVSAVEDGEAAWELLQRRAVQLVVSDVEMPRLDGIGLTRRLRDERPEPYLPVILVTARGSEADRARGVQAGADAYIVKSAFDARELLDAVARLA